MLFPTPLVRGRLIRRYKRFLSDHELENGEIVTAHCANSGAMLGLDLPGAEVWLSPATNPARKLAWTWELIRVDGGLVGINTGHPNAIAAEAIAAGLIPELTGYESIRREVEYGQNSRIDLLLEGPGRPKCWVEIKNVHLKRGPAAEFPDAVTARGAKHLAELAERVRAGDRAVMLYLVQRSDCDSFQLASDIDPAYATAFALARRAGVEAFCYACALSPDGIRVDRPLPVVLP
ncbi:DNA/RNA nuclease SfsA [Telmatospirillum sp. J64-1]|uniref:DNA/RNA nuclease SfsA n=1 Tax=Telmatospirillum sp. J64-1 TaxID=2502183 RepID=UPI00115E5612|nr:DNA/RNA nuclease SfsA [Telmatospirillum sp. J64-1]